MEQYNLKILMRDGYRSETADFTDIGRAVKHAIDLMDGDIILGWCLIDFYDAHKSDTDFKTLGEYPVIAQSQNWHTLI